MSLYRKYRPQKFLDLVGQEHVKTTLINALKSGKFSHAYLFAGPKGSGKTSTARLLAKALNCTGRSLNQQNFEPCDQCLSCKEIIGGRSLDVIEIDAASNRGIDEIRDLREKIRFAPTSSQYKIYVIDECHMLTKEAFNALLKTLEEPPSHAVFILATTELHKVPPTILSRAQVFDFKKANLEEIALVLKKIAKAEKLNIEEEALQLIARLAFGAYRDAVTMLDQVANLRANARITLTQVQIILGQATEKSVWDLVEALADKDRNRALKIVSDIYFEGKNLENFVAQLIEILRKIILAQAGLGTQFEASKDEMIKIQRLAEQITSDELILMIEKFTEVIPKVKTSILGQLPLEMVIFQLTANRPPITEKELDISIGDGGSQSTVVGKQVNLKPQPAIQKPELQKAVVGSRTTNSLSNIWPDVVKSTKTHNNSLAALLKDAAINSIEGDKVILGVKFKFHAEQICNQKNRQIIEDALTQHTGRTCRVDCIIDPALGLQKPLDSDEELLNSAKEVFEAEE